MYRTIGLLIISILAAAAWAGEQVLLQKASGEVLVRPGVTETWLPATSGQALPADATIRTGAGSSAIIVVRSSNRALSLPAEVMVDVSDLRELTQEELMLKLTMERVRATSYEWKNRDLNLPATTTFRGAPKERTEELTEGNLAEGRLQLNGARVLYNNAFYSTSALKAMDVLRRYPSLSSFESRLLIAEALQKARLKGEALNEYVAISRLPDLTPEQQALVTSRIAELKKN